MPHMQGQPSAKPAPQDSPLDDGNAVLTIRPRSLRKDFLKAYRKARDWHCAPLRSCRVALRFALFGDSGRFASHGGWRVSRIRRDGF